MPTPILTVTVNPAVDVAVTVEYLVPDHKVEALSNRRDPGGGGINVSRVLRRLGVESRAWVAVGGATGEELVSLVEAEGIETITHELAGVTRESIAISDLRAGQQYRILLPGPEVTDHQLMLDTIIHLAAGTEVVVLSGGITSGVPPSFYATICEALPDVTTVVDTKAAALAAVVESSADVVKPSRRELASLVNWIPANRGEIELAARQVLDRGAVGALVVSLGPDGAVLVERSGAATWFESPEVVVSSTVGAGDATIAGLVAGLTMGHSLVEATRRGVAAGTATVLTPGTDLCHPEDVDRLLADVVIAD